jgi:hypothetical protein
MANYNDLIKAGLLNAGDRRDAGLMGLIALGQSIGNRGAARLSPTPPPLDLAGPMAVYQNSMNTALQRGALAKKMRDEERLRGMFAPRPVNEQTAQRMATGVVNPIMAQPAMDDPGAFGSDYDTWRQGYMDRALPLAREQTTVPTALAGVPAAARPLISAVAEVNPMAGVQMAGNLMAEQFKYRKPEYHNVTVDGTPMRLTTPQLEQYREQGATIAPYSAPTTSINMNAGRKADEGFVDWALKRSNTLQENAQSASGTIASMTQLSSILDSGISTGFGTETITEIQRLGQRFGWTSEATNAAIASKEGFAAETMKLILPAVKQLGVNPTDKDLDFIVQGNPSLGKTLAGNRFMIEILKVKAARDQKLGEFDRDFMTQNGDLLRTNPMEYRVRYMREISNLTRTDPLWTEAVKNLRSAAPAGTQLPSSLQ